MRNHDSRIGRIGAYVRLTDIGRVAVLWQPVVVSCRFRALFSNRDAVRRFEFKLVKLTKFCLISLVPAGLSLSSCCSSSKGSPVNLANSDFESGVVAPWVAFQAVQASISSDRVHGGKFSLAEDSGKGSVYGDVKGLLDGAEYTVKAWVFAEPGTTAAAQIGVFDGKIATFSPTISPQGVWKPIKHLIKAPPDGAIRIHLFRNEGIGKVYWDDVQVSRN